MPTTSRATDERAKVRAYISRLPNGAARAMRKLSAAIRTSAPRATDAWSYSIPAYRLDGKILIYYAAWKDHVSLYPISAEFTRANAAAVNRYSTSGKGTIRFSLGEPIPIALVKRLVRFRIATLSSKA